MKLYCQYSGVPYSLPHLRTAHSSVVTVHPVFHMDKKPLFKLYSDWQEGLIEDETDCRLLFLAMLNATELIDWKATANPSNATVQAHMSNMYYTCKWVTAVNLPSMKLPHFAVTNDTRSLSNIKYWLDVWEQIREDFDAGYKSQSDILKQQQREEMLEKLIKTEGGTEVPRFAGLLAQWSFEAADVPQNIRTYWRDILTTKGINIFSVSKADMSEMVEHYETALAEHGSIYSHCLLKHVRSLQSKLLTGLGFSITNSLDLVDVVTRSEFSIVDADTEDAVTITERINVQKLINSAPSQQPVESDYGSKVSYLRAKISWQMAQRAQANRETAEEQLQQKLNTAFLNDEVIITSEGGI